MTRLPIIGGDMSTWGSILNAYLSVAHNADGTLKSLISALDFPGIDPTGAGDSTTALQNAINAALATGNTTATVMLPPGTYKYSSSLNATGATGSASGNGIILRGAGRGATRLLKAGNFAGVTFNGNGGPNGHPSKFGGLVDITLDGGSHTGALLQTNSAQQMFFRGCSFINNNDVTLDLNTMQDSYFAQCTSNNCGSTSQPVVSIYGSSSGTSNMLWFEQCRIEAFLNGAVWIKRGSGATGGGNNGFFFSQLKLETTTVNGDFFVADSYTQQLYIDQCFIAMDSFNGGYSTPANAILFGSASASPGSNQASFRDIFVYAASGICKSALNINDSSGALGGTVSIDNVFLSGTPTTAIIVANGATSLSFDYGLVGGSGTVFGGDGTGTTNAILRNTKVTGTLECTDALNADNGITSTSSTNTFKTTHFDASGTSTGSPLYVGISNLTSGTAGLFQLGDPLTSFQVANGGALQLQAYHMLELSGGRTTGTQLSFRTGTVNGVGLDAYSVLITNDQSGTALLAIQAHSGQTANILDALNSSGGKLFSVLPSGQMQLQNASTFYSGSGAPNNANGANGDYYFRSDTPGTANQRIYAKASGAWLDALDGPQYCYLPSGWDTAWKAAKALVGSQKVNVVAVGDSITQGWGATDMMTDSYFACLRASILSANNNALGGDFYGVLYSSAINGVLGGPGTATPPLVLYGTNNSDYYTTYGVLGVNIYVDHSETPFIVCTPPYNVVGFEIVYLDFTAGSWTYKIDSGSAVTVTTTGPATYPGAILKKISITGLSAGSHTLTINAPSGGGALNIEGITAYKATTGLCFANMGVPGLGLYAGVEGDNNLATISTFPPDRIALYQGYQGTTASPSALTGLGFPTQPDLAIVALGVNDAGQSVASSDFQTALRRLVWSLRYGKNDACSIILVAMWAPDGDYASSVVITNMDYTSTAKYYTAYRDIRKVMLECAQENNCAFVDVYSAFGRQPIANGWVTSTSDLHPTPAGHLKIADLLGSIV